jgi:AcrR family transcriptional regulator
MAIAASTTEGDHPAPTSRTSSPAETRARLIEAAIEVFLENGYAKTRVQDIAKRAGLTTGAMYAHFKNKAALLSEAIALHGDVAMNELVDAMDGDAHGPAGLSVGVRALSGESRPVDRLMLEALAVSARGDENEDLIGPALERMRATLHARVESAHRAGALDPSISADALTSLFQRVVLGSIVAKAIGLPTEDPSESEHLIATILLSLMPADQTGER